VQDDHLLQPPSEVVTPSEVLPPPPAAVQPLPPPASEPRQRPLEAPGAQQGQQWQAQRAQQEQLGLINKQGLARQEPALQGRQQGGGDPGWGDPWYQLNHLAERPPPENLEDALPGAGGWRGAGC